MSWLGGGGIGGGGSMSVVESADSAGSDNCTLEPSCSPGCGNGDTLRGGDKAWPRPLFAAFFFLNRGLLGAGGLLDFDR